MERTDDPYELNRGKRRERVTRCHTALEKVRTDLEANPPTESRLDALIEAQMVKLEPQSKRLMDLLRSSARNGFYHALQPFKKAYDNYRDDHALVERIVDCFGEINSRGDVVNIQKNTFLPKTLD